MRILTDGAGDLVNYLFVTSCFIYSKLKLKHLLQVHQFIYMVVDALRNPLFVLINTRTMHGAGKALAWGGFVRSTLRMDVLYLYSEKSAARLCWARG